MNMAGTFWGTVFDGDLWDGDITIDIALSGGAAFGASVGISWVAWTDTSEGDVAAGVAFSSDDLGDQSSDEWTFKSSELPDSPFYGNETTRQHLFGYKSDCTLRKGKGGESKAKAVIQGSTWAYAPGAAHPKSSSGASIESIGYLAYYLEVPTYEQGTVPLPGPEQGY